MKGDRSEKVIARGGRSETASVRVDGLESAIVRGDKSETAPVRGDGSETAPSRRDSSERVPARGDSSKTAPGNSDVWERDRLTRVARDRDIQEHKHAAHILQVCGMGSSQPGRATECVMEREGVEEGARLRVRKRDQTTPARTGRATPI